jgi:hypothetical protein
VIKALLVRRVMTSLIIAISALTGTQALAQTTCTSIHYMAPSGPANSITFTFDQPYPCGQFANGDWFAIPVNPGGKVTITGITPAYNSGRNGWDVNIDVRGGVYQAFDNRLSDFREPPSLPYAAKKGSSIIKTVSKVSCTSQTCVQFAAVLTVLESIPDHRGTTFRPPAFGAVKPLLSARGLQTSSLPSFPASCCPEKLIAQAALARSKGFRNNYSPHSIWGYFVIPADNVANGRAWGGDMWLSDSEILGYLMLDVPMKDKLPVLIAYVQQGIDIWGASKFAGGSWYRGGGGNGAGALVTYAFAAAMLNDPGMLADLKAADMNSFLEATDFYLGRNGVALYGGTTPYDNEESYWAGLKNGDATTRTLRDPHGYIDGGPVPGAGYEATLANQVSSTSIMLRAFPAFRSAWPTKNDSVTAIIEFGRRYHDRKTLTKPDPCAPPVGTYGVDYGPNGHSQAGFLDCIPGSGRFPLLNGSDHANRLSPFMAAFYDYVDRALNSAR